MSHRVSHVQQGHADIRLGGSQSEFTPLHECRLHPAVARLLDSTKVSFLTSFTAEDSQQDAEVTLEWTDHFQPKF